MVVQSDRLLRRALRFGNSLANGQEIIKTEQEIGIGQAAPGQRVVAIFQQRQLEKMQRLLEPETALVSMTAAFDT